MHERAADGVGGGTKKPAEAGEEPSASFRLMSWMDLPVGDRQGARLDRPAAWRGRSNTQGCGGGMRRRLLESVPDIRARNGLVAPSAQYGI